KQSLGVNKPIHVISGYRSPYTNAHLRKQSHRVAKHSLHMQGRAIDIRIEGLSTKTIRNAALAMGRGGVGYYPHANFVHLDTGEVRTW
ncbi:MAG: YcbK family protein, partial [Methylobacter sp.]